MKKLLALLAALAMLCALPAAALAEDSTIYRLSVYDPIFYVNDEPVFDLTGLNVDLLAATTDTGLNGLILQLYGSEDLELIASATAQIDPLGLTFGINEVTPVRVDLAEMFDMGGLSPYALLSSIPLRSLLLSLPELAGSSEPAQSNAASAEQRMNAIGAALSSFVTETTTEGNVSVHAFAISREQFDALLSSIGSMTSSFGAELPASELSGEISGTITAAGNPANGDATLSIDAAGNLFEGETAVPFTLTLVDDMSSIDADLVFEADGSSAALTLDAAFGATSDGRESTTVDFAAVVEGSEAFTLHFAVEPAEGSARVDSIAEIASPLTGDSLRVSAATDANEEYDESFDLSVSAVSASEEFHFSTGYFGNVYNDGDEYGDYRNGIFAVSVSDGSAQYSFDTEIMLFTEDFYDSSDWALDYENALDANAMSSSDVNAWTVDLLAALNDAAEALGEKVPTLAPYLDAMMGSVYGA